MTARRYDPDRRGSVRRRDPPPPRAGRRADLLRRRAGAAAPGRGRRGRRQSALVHELGGPGARGHAPPRSWSTGGSWAGSAGPIRRSGRACIARFRRQPYIFSRISRRAGGADRVLVAMDQGDRRQDHPGLRRVPGRHRAVDAYSGVSGTVRDGSGLAHDRIGSGAAGASSGELRTTETRGDRLTPGSTLAALRGGSWPERPAGDGSPAPPAGKAVTILPVRRQAQTSISAIPRR